ncbi:MAG: hypothetical protein H2069_01235 [Legionella sp.]|nr:hypothetical protein [Legionella sp.]
MMYVFLPDVLKHLIFSFLSNDELLQVGRLIDHQSQTLSLHHLFNRVDDTVIEQQFQLLNQWISFRSKTGQHLTTLQISALNTFFHSNDRRALEYQTVLLQEWLSYLPNLPVLNNQQKDALSMLQPTLEAKLQSFATDTIYKNLALLSLLTCQSYPRKVDDAFFSEFFNQFKQALDIFRETPSSHGSTYQRPKKIFKDYLKLLMTFSATVFTAPQINTLCLFINETLCEKPKGEKILLRALAQLTNFLNPKDMPAIHSLLIESLCRSQRLLHRYSKTAHSSLDEWLFPANYQLLISTFIKKIQSKECKIVFSNESILALLDQKAYAHLDTAQRTALIDSLMNNFHQHYLLNDPLKDPLNNKKLEELYKILELGKQLNAPLNKEACHLAESAVTAAFRGYFSAWHTCKKSNTVSYPLRESIRILAQIIPFLFTQLDKNQQLAIRNLLANAVISKLQDTDRFLFRSELVTTFFFPCFHILSTLASTLTDLDKIALAQLMLHYQSHLSQDKERKAFTSSLTQILKQLSSESFLAVAPACVDYCKDSSVSYPFALSLFVQLTDEQKRLFYRFAATIDISHVDSRLKITGLLSKAFNLFNEDQQTTLVKQLLTHLPSKNNQHVLLILLALSSLCTQLSSSQAITFSQKLIQQLEAPPKDLNYEDIFYALSLLPKQLPPEQQTELTSTIRHFLKNFADSALDNKLLVRALPYAYVEEKIPQKAFSALIKQLKSPNSNTCKTSRALQSLSTVLPQLDQRQWQKTLDRSLHVLHETYFAEICAMNLSLIEQLFTHLPKKQQRILQKLSIKVSEYDENTTPLNLKTFNELYEKLTFKKKMQFADHILHTLRSPQSKKYLAALDKLKLLFPHLQASQRTKTFSLLSAHFNQAENGADSILLFALAEITPYLERADLIRTEIDKNALLQTCKIIFNAIHENSEEGDLDCYFQLLRTLTPVLPPESKSLMAEKIFKQLVQNIHSDYFKEGLELLGLLMMEDDSEVPNTLITVLCQIIELHAEEKTKSLVALKMTNQLAFKLTDKALTSLATVINPWVEDNDPTFRLEAAQFMCTYKMNLGNISTNDAPSHTSASLFLPEKTTSSRKPEYMAMHSNLYFFSALKHHRENTKSTLSTLEERTDLLNTNEYRFN